MWKITVVITSYKHIFVFKHCKKGTDFFLIKNQFKGTKSLREENYIKPDINLEHHQITYYKCKKLTQ